MRIKKWIGRFFLFLLGILLTLVGIVAIFMVSPSWFVKPKTIEWAAKRAQSLGYQVDWKNLGVAAKAPSLLLHEYEFSFDGLCVRDAEVKDGLQACFEHLSLGLEVNFKSIPPRLRTLGPVEAKGAKIEIPGAPGEKEEVWKGDLEVSSDAKKNPPQGELRGKFHSGPKKISAAIRFDLSFSHLHAVLDAETSGIVPEVRSFGVKDCVVKDDPEHGGARIQLDCPVHAVAPRPATRWAEAAIPPTLDARVRADLKSSDFLPGEKSHLEGRVEFESQKARAPIADWNAKLQANVRGMIGELTEGKGLDASGHLVLRVPKFEKLVSWLGESRLAVPAPFRVLHGELLLDAFGKTDLRSTIVPLHLKTHLGSSDQKLDVEGDARFQILPASPDHPRPELSADVVLQDAAFELPVLGLEAPPRLLPDRRIRATEKRTIDPPDFMDYRLRLRTEPGHPLQVKTNLAETAVPIDLDMRLASDEPPQGTVRLGQFPTKIFRREGTIEHFSIDVRPVLNRSPIDGLMRIPYSGYLLSIQLVGEVGKPRILFSSDPPIPPDQLVAQLLFGQTPETLTPDQSATVGNAQTAFSQGAVGLASFYLLASTPIQSLGYNPDTGEISGTVGIGEGTAIRLGTERRGLTVGVQKRIGPRWSVTTQLENSQTTGESTGVAYLLWANRY